MKRNITPPAAQQSLFGSDSATATVLPPPKTPRARAVAKTSAAAAPVMAEENVTNAKIAKTNPTVKASPAKVMPVQALAVPRPEPPARKTPAVKALVPSKAASATTTASAKTVVAVKAAAPIKVTPVKTADGSAKQKIAKTNSQLKKSAPTVAAVRVANEPVFEGGMLWKMSGRNGVAYIKDAALAGELLAIEPKKLAQAAMAVYYDKKGKAFAWQVRFDTERWDEVMKRLG